MAVKAVPSWLATEPESTSPPLAGTAPGSAREPKRKPAPGERGSIGDKAVIDGLVIVVAAWTILFFLAYSLRHHNV